MRHMSAMMETPVVVIDVQRAGPSTRVPTKTEQGDLWQMLGAGFGDFPRVTHFGTSVRNRSIAPMMTRNVSV